MIKSCGNSKCQFDMLQNKFNCEDLTSKMLTLVGVGKKYLPLRQSYFVVGQLSREYSTKPVQNDKKSDDNIGKYFFCEFSVDIFHIIEVMD